MTIQQPICSTAALADKLASFKEKEHFITLQLRQLEQDAARISFDVADGNENARTRLAEINAEIDELRSEKTALERAESFAETRKGEIGEAERDERRRKELTQARQHRDGLIETLGKLEAMSADFAKLQEQAIEQQLAIRTHIRNAGMRVEDHMMGRDIGTMTDAIRHEFTKHLGGPSYERQEPLRLVAMAQSAWGVLDGE